MINQRLDNYSLLMGKLDAFIRKYYLNQLLRGFLYTIGLVLAFFLAISLSEYFFYFSPAIRKTMGWSFIATSFVSAFFWVLLPLFHYFRLGRTISHEQAATIVGNHFTNVKDKLLNILQLKQQQSYNPEFADLITASIQQKSEEMKPVPFKAAIDLTKNRKYLRYALPPLLALGGILLVAPNIIRDSANRLYNNNKEFERPAPFHFSLANKDLRVLQYEDFKLEVNVDGTTLPQDVFIDLGGFQYKLEKESPTKFTYQFNKVQTDEAFKLTANGYNSDNYKLDILEKPSLSGMQVGLDYPSYTGRKDESLTNVGDLIVPVGTQIVWLFNAQHATQMDVQFGRGLFTPAKNLSTGNFSFGTRAMQDTRYSVFLSNQYVQYADSVSYNITTQADAHPTIVVQRFADTTDGKIIYFAGDATDDYGISRLNVNFKIDGAGRPKNMTTLPLKNNAGTATQFTYNMNVLKMQLKPGEKLTYYFEVFDNDAVHGAKSARTDWMSFEMPTKEEFQQKEEQNNEEIKADLSKAMKEAQELQQEVKALSDKLMQKKTLNWQDKKEMENLLKKQEELKKKLESAKQNLDENIENQKEFKKADQELLDRQQQLQEMMEKVMNKEMMKMMEEMQKMLEEMNKNETMENLDKMEMSNEELAKELDRLEELFKQMELDQKIDEAVEKLEELAKEEEKLADQAEKDLKDSKELEKKQDELNKKFDDVKKDLEDIQKKNEELEKPKELEDTKEDEKEIDQDMDKSSEDLQKGDKSGASKSQKKASKKMKNMANKMKAAKQKAEMEQMDEDIRALRQILENLVEISFAQENTMENVRETPTVAPKYVKLVQTQQKIKDDFKMVEDSLLALAKRNFKIQSFVTEKVTEVNNSVKKSIEFLEDRNKNSGVVQQQKAMTGINDLALMLAETMDQMQQSMAEGMPGNQSCSKPGGKGKGKKGKGLGDMQQQLNDQISKMKEEMGKNPGGKPGKGGKGGMSKQFAEAAKQQSAIRQKLKEMQQAKQQRGEGGDKGLDDLIKDMEKTEEQLVNKQLTNEMQKRQQDIMGKLLEHEKAEREREYDEQRQGETAKEKPRKPPVAFEEYVKKRQAALDMYRTTSPALRPYYKSLVDSYFNSLRGK